MVLIEDGDEVVQVDAGEQNEKYGFEFLFEIQIRNPFQIKGQYQRKTGQENEYIPKGLAHEFISKQVKYKAHNQSILEEDPKSLEIFWFLVQYESFPYHKGAHQKDDDQRDQ